MTQILLVEDEPGIATLVRRGLEAEGFRVDTASNGLLGYEMASSEAHHLVILDVMLPGMDGFEICKKLRAKGISVPVMMLTAKDALADKVQGLDTGADDYLPKPFDFPELLARVRALIRRDRVHKRPVVEIGDLVIDVAKRRVERAGAVVPVSSREYDLLEALASREGMVLTRETIQNLVWKNADAYSNVVDVYVRSLRKKVDEGHSVKLIHTVHGVGYTLRRSETT